MPTLDDLYGVSLNEYCAIHGTTPEALIQKTCTDIALLRQRLHRLVWNAEQDPKNEDLIPHVKEKMERKQRHLERLMEWAAATKLGIKKQKEGKR